MVEREARSDVFFERAERVNARVFCPGEPAHLIHAVTGQIVEGTHVFVGIEVERWGIRAEFVRVRGDQADQIAKSPF